MEPAPAYLLPITENDAQRVSALALECAKKGGAVYADVRILRTRTQHIQTREDKVQAVCDNETLGYAVRVLWNGTWGFAASSNFSEKEVRRIAELAVSVAKGNSRLQRSPVVLAKSPVSSGYWKTPLEVDPFSVGVQDKVNFQLELNELARKGGANFCTSGMTFVHEHKYFNSTEGVSIKQDLYRQQSASTVTVVDTDRGTFETRNTLAPASGQGYEAIQTYPYRDEIQTAVEHAKMKLAAPPVRPGKRDLIIHPTNLWLTIHESCAHPTELDRVLGMEANFAGTSFITLESVGKLRYGSEQVTMIADKTQRHGLSTAGFDDDGTPTCEFPIVDAGLLVNLQSTRELAGAIGAEQSFATAYADSWYSVPIQRIPNISLQPGKKKLSLEELIQDTEDGLLVIGDDSFSIDMQRYNFQFSAQEFWEIKNGKRAGLVRDAAYQGNTVQFWNSCDAVCDSSQYFLGGCFSCGKGEPCQAAPVSHGASPARFRQVNVLNLKGQR